MKRKRVLLGVALLAAGYIGLGCAHSEHEDEKPITLEKTPAAVQSAITKVLAGQKADKIVTENEDGQTRYEVTYHVNGQERSAEFTAAGETVEQEADVAVGTLPAAVSDSVMRKYPGAKIDEAADVKAGGQEYYELGIKLSGGAEREVKVDANGSIRADKAEGNKEKD
jgi:uncharacterized membrane protein YkoI